MNFFEKVENQANRILQIAEDIQINKDRPNLAIACKNYKDKVNSISLELLEIKEMIDLQYGVCQPTNIENLRIFTLRLLVLSKDLYNGINQEDDSLVRRYSRDILDEVQN